METGDTSAPVVSESPTPLIDNLSLPAPAADEQKPADTPAPVADDKKQETTEQQEQRKQSRRAAQREREAEARGALQAENRLLREQLARGAQQQPATSLEPAAPKREDFPDYETYLEARTDYRADQKVNAALKAAKDEAQARTTQGKAVESQNEQARSWNKREAEFQKTTKDYADVVTPFVSDDIGKLSQAARSAIVDSEAGPKLLHHLASNPDEFDAMVGLSQARQVAKLVELEDKLAVPAPKKSTEAPPPPSPVSQSRSVSPGLTGNESQADYEKKRKEMGARWARR